MSVRLKLPTLIAALSFSLLAPTGMVLAAPGGGGGAGTGGSQSGGVLIAQVKYTTGGRGGGSSGDGCRWRLVDGTIDVDGSVVVTFPREINGVTYHLWEGQCPSVGYPTYYAFPETQPRDLLPALLDQLRQQRLPSPDPVFAQLDPVRGWAYVTVPMDFRTGGDSWRTVSVSASLGPVWATVTAQPLRLTFDPGDAAGNGPVSCVGDGPIAAYAPSTPGACSYTYSNASSTSPYDGYHFLTEMSIDWAVSWTSSTGAGGPLDTYSTSSTVPLAVAEVKGVVTCTGSRSEQGGC